MATIRIFTEDDVPGVGALFVRVYPEHRRSSQAACECYFREMLPVARPLGALGSRGRRPHFRTTCHSACGWGSGQHRSSTGFTGPGRSVPLVTCSRSWTNVPPCLLP
jgi:hypothetical protein